jgi:stage II sporulation protein D
VKERSEHSDEREDVMCRATAKPHMKLICTGLLLLAALVVLPASRVFSASAPPVYVRVRLTSTFPVQLKPNVPSTLLLDNSEIETAPGEEIVVTCTSSGLEVFFQGKVIPVRWMTLKHQSMPPANQPALAHGVRINGGHLYRGAMEALTYNGQPLLINVVPMNDYLYGVLGAEMPLSWPTEALKAQAVASRTYALYHTFYRGPNDPTPWDVGDTQDSQVYCGTSKESPRAYEAVRLTDREVLVYNGPDPNYQGKLIDAVFHSTSPGRTFNAEDVWSSYRPYLRARDDALFSQVSPRFSWGREFVISISALASCLGMSQITLLTPVFSGDDAHRYTASGDGTVKTFTKEQLRKWFNLPSPAFELKTINGQPIDGPTPPGEKLAAVAGKGYGHGVGLSQYGAKAMADAGWSYKRILTYYYTDVQVIPYRLWGMRLPKDHPGRE